MLWIQFRRLTPMVLGNKVASFLDSEYIHCTLIFNNIHRVCWLQCGNVIYCGHNFMALTNVFPQFVGCVVST